MGVRPRKVECKDRWVPVANNLVMIQWSQGSLAMVALGVTHSMVHLMIRAFFDTCVIKISLDEPGNLGEHVLLRHDTDNIFHPRYIRDGILPVNTFHAIVHRREAKWVS